MCWQCIYLKGFFFWFRPLQFFEFGEMPLQFTYSEICYYNFISPSSMSFSTSAMYKGPLSGHVYVQQHIATSSPPSPMRPSPPANASPRSRATAPSLAATVRHQHGKGVRPLHRRGAPATDGLLAGAALVRLEAALQRRAGSPAARLADLASVHCRQPTPSAFASLHGPRPDHDQALLAPTPATTSHGSPAQAVPHPRPSTQPPSPRATPVPCGTPLCAQAPNTA
jgi:hypothetical protein